MSEFSAGIVGQNSELFDSINRRLEYETSVHAVEIIRTVNEKVVRLRTLTVDGISLLFAKRAACFEKARRQRHHSRLKQAELGKIAAIERKVIQFALLDDFPQAGYGRLDQLRIGVNIDDFLFRTDAQADRDHRGFVHIQRNAFLRS